MISCNKCSLVTHKNYIKQQHGCGNIDCTFDMISVYYNLQCVVLCLSYTAFRCYHLELIVNRQVDKKSDKNYLKAVGCTIIMSYIYGIFLQRGKAFVVGHTYMKPDEIEKILHIFFTSGLYKRLSLGHICVFQRDKPALKNKLTTVTATAPKQTWLPDCR